MSTEEKKSGIVLPTKPRAATHVNARDVLISGKPKCGKTSAVCQLPNVLLIDLEQGSAFQNVMVMEPPAGSGPVGKWKWLKDVAKSIEEAGKPYDYVVIDTLTEIDSLAEWVGTFQFMHSIAGKNFNRELDEDGKVKLNDKKQSIMLRPNHPDYQSVHSLPNGSGYAWSRSATVEMYETLRYLGKISTIFVAHVIDKMVAEKSGEVVTTKEISLTGKLKDIIARKVDAVATVWNEDGELMISFEGNTDKIGGMRAQHLKDFKGKLDWSKIFIKQETTTDVQS